MKKTGKTFNAGDLVFAKVRGYPPWPARVTATADKNASKFHVFFYGTYETAVCKKEELWHYDDTTKTKYGRNKSKMFPEALDEIENRPEIALAAEDDAVDEKVTEANAESVPPHPTETHEDSSSEDNALVIDEEAKGGAKAKNRGTKRKAEEAPVTPSEQPPTKQVKVKITPLSPLDVATFASPAKPPATPVDEKTSRSGRLIKPKKFVDESPQSSPPQAPAVTLIPAASPPPSVAPVITKIFSPPRKDDPKRETEASPKPNEIRLKVVSKETRSLPIEAPVVTSPPKICKDTISKETFVASKMEKIRWLKIEQRIIDLNLDLKKSVHFQKPNMGACLQLLKELQTLAIAPLMFKKQPDIVLTVRLLKKYCGPSAQVQDQMKNESRNILSKSIRTEATKAFARIKSLFSATIKSNFDNAFEDEVAAFREATKDMPQQRIALLVKDPSV